MTLSTIDKERYSFLLSFGTQAGELKRFFSECTKALILKGARIRNAPHGDTERIRLIVEKLPRAADDVVRMWFHRNLAIVDPVPPEVFVSTFRGLEAENRELPEDEARHFARSGLFHLFGQQQSEELVAFLQEPIPGRGRRTAVLDCEMLKPNDEAPAREWHVPYSVLALLVAAFDGSRIDDLLDAVPENLSGLVAGLVHISRGDERAARQSLRELDAESEEATLLGKAITRMRGRVGEREREAGVVIHEEVPFGGDVDLARGAVFAYCTNDKPTATFVDPVGAICDGHLHRFSVEQKIAFFPERGSVIVFSGAVHRQPARGELGVWAVEEHATEKQTRCHVSKEAADLIEIIKISAHSSDADSVRELIRRDFSHRRATEGRKHVYELDDGRIIAPKGLRVDLSKDESFENAFDLWLQVEAFSFEGRVFTVGPLPKTTLSYDCAPLHVAARSLLRTLRDRSKAQLTKAQIREIVALCQEEEDAITRQRMARVVERIDSADAEDALIHDMVEFSIELPRFRLAINQRIEDHISEEALRRDDASSMLLKLQAECLAAESRLKTLEKEYRKRSLDIEQRVKRVFDEAIAKNIETSTLSVIYSGLAPQSTLTSAKHIDISQTPVLPATRELPGSDRETVLRSLRLYCLNRRFAGSLLTLTSVIADVGLILVVKGAFARQIAAVLASSVGDAAVVDVGLGEVAPMEAVSKAIASVRPSIVLVNADLSDFSLYGSEIVDLCFEQLSSGSSRRLVVASLSESPLALPLPSSLSRIAVSVDLEWSSAFESSASTDMYADFNVEAWIRGQNLLGASVERMVERISSLEGYELQGVAAILDRALPRKNA